MRVVYFTSDDEDGRAVDRGAIALSDVTRVFQQLELLFKYASQLTPAADHELELGSAFPEREISIDASEELSIKDRAIRGLVEKRAMLARTRFEGTELQNSDAIRDLVFDAWAEAAMKSLEGRKPLFPLDMPDRLRPALISLRMGSPLEVVAQVPLAAWPLLGVGLIALAERIATMPVRIARKWKQERLKSAVLDKQTQAVIDTRADVFASLAGQRTSRPPRGHFPGSRRTRRRARACRAPTPRLNRRREKMLPGVGKLARVISARSPRPRVRAR